MKNPSEPLDVLVEIPAWSFVKHSYRAGRWVEDFRSPLPTMFNYGLIPNTRAEDGMPQDVVVLGRRLKTGDRLQAYHAATVRFIDNGLRDDKLVLTDKPRKLKKSEILMLRFFFTVYASYKRTRGVACKFEGLVKPQRSSGKPEKPNAKESQFRTRSMDNLGR